VKHKNMPRKKTKTEEFIEGLAPKNEAKSNENEPKADPTNGKLFNILKRHWKIIVLATVALIFLMMAGANVFFYREWREFKSGKNGNSQNDVAAITKKIGKFMELPADETPTIATVSDREKLKEQPFFTKAQNGDKVLIYTKSQKAILYRPSANQIIEVMNLSANNTGSVVADSQQPVNKETAPEAQPASEQQGENLANTEPGLNENKVFKVAVLNGTSIKGVAKTLSDKIAQVKNVEIGTTGNAKGNYKSTLVIDVTGGNGEKAREIASLINGTVADFPAVEIKPDADILVIGGNE
jgi:hypothetical protein